MLRRTGWAAVLVSLGVMVASTTYFQLTLPRLHAEWIGAAVQQHNLVLEGIAGNPWQYRVLSDRLIQALFDVLIAINNRNPYLYGFVLFRGAQEVGIFALGFVYLRKLGFSLVSSIVGLSVICIAMLIGQVQTNWRLDEYTDVFLYLMAGVLVVSRRFALMIPLSILAALNRETGVFIPLMPLCLVDLRSLRAEQNYTLYRTAGISLICFVIVRIGLHLVSPSQALSSRVATDDVTGAFMLEAPFVYVAIALGVVPLIASIGLPPCNTFVRHLFWLIVPAWFATHWWGTVSMTPIAFIVPLALVLVPSALYAAPAAWRTSPSRQANPMMVGNAYAVDAIATHWPTVAALAVVYLLGPVVAGVARTLYPFPLERIEGAMLQETRRITLGLPIYVAPTLAYVPTLYAPLYFYVSAGVSLVTGVSFLPLRLVSLVASLGSAILVYLLASRDGPGRLAGILAAGLLLGTTQLETTDLNPVRVDALCLLLILAAIVAARYADHNPASVVLSSAACGLLAGLAVLTKQTAGVVALALLIVTLPQPRARLLPYLAGLGATLGVATLLLLASSDGWARLYLVDLPRNHSLQWNALAAFWTFYLLPHLFVPVLLALAFFVVRCLDRDFASVWFYLLVAGGLVGMGWVSILNPGGGTTSLLYAYAGLSLLFGMGFQDTLRLASTRGPRLRAVQIGLFGVTALALVAVEYRPESLIPLRANALAGQRLVEAMANLPGSVWAPDLGEFQLRAGKGDQAYPPMWKELLGDYGGTALPVGIQYMSDLDQALVSGRFVDVVVDPEGTEPRLKDYAASYGYIASRPLLPKGDPFFVWQRGIASGGGAVTPAPDLYTREVAPP